MAEGSGELGNQEIPVTTIVKDEERKKTPVAIASTSPLVRKPTNELEETASLVPPNPELVPQNIKEILDQGALGIRFNLTDKSIIKELGLSKDINTGYGEHLSRNCSQSIILGLEWSRLGIRSPSDLIGNYDSPPYGLLIACKMPLSEEKVIGETKMEHKKILGIKLPMKEQIRVSKTINVPASSGEYIDGLNSKDPILAKEPLVIISAIIHTNRMFDDYGRNVGLLLVNVGLPESLYKKIEADIHKSPALILDYAREIYPVWYKHYIAYEEKQTGIMYRDSIKPAFEIGKYSDEAMVRGAAQDLKEKSK